MVNFVIVQIVERFRTVIARSLMTRASERYLPLTAAVGVSSSVRRAIGDAAMFASGVMILVFALVVTDARVRERALMVVGAGAPAAHIADLGTRLSDLSEIVVQVVWHWSREHRFLTIFAAAALVLVIAILRL